jgi:selenocysteine lyase/cysteine desulfurase
MSSVSFSTMARLEQPPSPSKKNSGGGKRCSKMNPCGSTKTLQWSSWRKHEIRLLQCFLAKLMTSHLSKTQPRASTRCFDRWKFNAGDEILVPDHAYQACRNAIDFVANRWGVHVVTVNIPFPIDGPQAAIDAIMSGVSERTVLAMIDTVTSPTGLRMPFEELVPALEGMGVSVLLDAAHGIGMVPLNLDALGASYTTSNCHKWLCAPKGSAFLHVRNDRQLDIHPLTISHGMSFPLGDTTRFRHEFDWTGTRDISAWCSLPATIEWMENLVEGGWPAIMKHNHDLAIEGRRILCERLGLATLCPDEMIACIATMRIPADAGNCSSGARTRSASQSASRKVRHPSSGLVLGITKRSLLPNLRSSLQPRR